VDRPGFEWNRYSVVGVLTGLGVDRPGFEWNRHSVVGVLSGLGDGPSGV
jgi:hypothetical protein